MPASEGANYAPAEMPNPVVEPGGEIAFAAMHLDHGHIYGMINGLTGGAGGTLTWVYDPQPERVAAFVEKFPPDVKVARSEEEILEDPAVKLVAAAAVPADRAPLGIRVMEAGKDYFTDKTPLISLDQLDAAKDAVARTGRKYSVYYSERIHVEAAVLAGQLIDRGAIGKVIQVMGMGPHRLGDPDSRPDWFYERARYGGILTDIGSHNFEQMLTFTGSDDAEISSSAIGNFAHHAYPPELDDFGEASIALSSAPPDMCASTGSPPRRVCAPGATAAPSSSAPTATWSCASTSTSPPTTAAVSSCSSTARASIASMRRARSAIRSSGS